MGTPDRRSSLCKPCSSFLVACMSFICPVRPYLSLIVATLIMTMPQDPEDTLGGWDMLGIRPVDHTAEPPPQDIKSRLVVGSDSQH